MKKLKNILLLFLVFTLVFSSLSITAYAQDEEEEDIPTAEEAIRDNYWADLIKVPSNEVDGELYIDNLLKPKETVFNGYVKFHQGYDYSRSTGIYKDLNTISYTVFGDAFDYISRPDEQKNVSDDGDPNFQNGKYHNPFNFDLNTDFIRQREQLNIYGDMLVNDNTESDIIAKHKVGENLKLNLNVDLSNFYKWEYAKFWFSINGISKGNSWKTEGVDGKAAIDSELVFSLDLPKGLIIPNDAKVSIVGLNDFSITRINQDGKVIFKLRKIQNTNNSNEPYQIITAKDYYDKIKRINLVGIEIDGVKISNDIDTGKNLQIVAKVSGMYSKLLIPTPDLDGNNKQPDEGFFAAKQSDAGRDAAADKNKPNLISYTFNVEERKSGHNPVVTFINDDRYYDEREVIAGTSINQNSYMPRDPEKRGYKFIEWNTMPDGSGMTFTGDTVVYEDMTVYAIYKKDRRYDDERETADEEPMLNINDHYQYMVGYKDATFRPNNNMTREEAAVMFSRLMVRRPIKGHIYNHNFKDIANTRWSATAISYMNELGFIKGYPDGTFKPEKSITRAEFAAMATRFANLFGGGLQGFVDVPYTHWANDVIAKAASAGWVSGYPDGTFKPENKITRAEVVSITNRMLTRRADKDFITKHRSAILWFTDTPTHWAFYDIAEACNGHDYTRQGTIEENWLNVNLKTFVYDK